MNKTLKKLLAKERHLLRSFWRHTVHYREKHNMKHLLVIATVLMLSGCMPFVMAGTALTLAKDGYETLCENTNGDLKSELCREDKE